MVTIPACHQQFVIQGSGTMSFDVPGASARLGAVLDAKPLITPADCCVGDRPTDRMRLATPPENRLVIDALSAHAQRALPDAVVPKDRVPAEDALRLSAEGLRLIVDTITGLVL